MHDSHWTNMMLNVLSKELKHSIQIKYYLFIYFLSLKHPSPTYIHFISQGLPDMAYKICM